MVRKSLQQAAQGSSSRGQQAPKTGQLAAALRGAAPLTALRRAARRVPGLRLLLRRGDARGGALQARDPLVLAVDVLSAQHDAGG